MSSSISPDKKESMPETRQERRVLARQESILSAAARVFAEKGFRHATIRDVAQAADVADGTIYNYFANKDALLDALITRLSVAEQQPIVSDPGPLEANVIARMQALHQQYEQVIAVLPEILGTPELRQRYLEQFVQPVSQALEQDLANQAKTSGDATLETALAARILLSSVMGFQVLMILGDPLTQAMWENPAALAKVWSRFLAFGLRE